MVFQLPVITGQRLKGNTLAASIAVTAATAFLLFGYDQGVMSGLLTEEEFFYQFPRIASPPFERPAGYPEEDSSIQGTVVAIYEVGAMVGSLLTLWKGDYFGRRTSMLAGSVTMLVGAIIMTSSFSLGQFIVGRIVTGIGNGLHTSNAPVWHAELSSANHRGFAVLIEGALIAGGIMISYWIDYGMFQVKGSSAQWRVPIGLQCFFAIIVFIGVLCCPESPRWLIRNGYNDQAAGVLAQLDNTTPDDPEIVATIESLEESIVKSEIELGQFSYRELFSNDKYQNFYRAIVGFTAQAFQQLSGINLITYYATTVFKSIVPDDNTARLLSCGNGTEYFVASIVAIFFVDRFGRRKLMFWTAALMAASMAVLAGTVSKVNSGPSGSASSYVAAVFLYLFNTWFAFGWLGMTWLYPPEISSIRIRASASSIATTANWLFNFLIVLITPPAFKNIGYQTYVVFAVLNFSFCPVIYCFFPEPKRRGLEEMDVIFAQAYDEGWWDAKHFMTRACYLSMNKKHLYGKELDREMALYFGNEKEQAVQEEKKQQLQQQQQLSRRQEDGASSRRRSEEQTQPADSPDLSSSAHA